MEIVVEANFPLMKSTYITQEKISAVQSEMQCKSISGLQNENFLSLKKNYLNSLSKHGTKAMLYLTKFCSYELVR
jgi:hypothetical protein